MSRLLSFILILAFFAPAFAEDQVTPLPPSLDNITGPGHDSQCRGRCNYNLAVQTVECAGKMYGLLPMSFASANLCSRVGLIPQGEDAANRNAIALLKCFNDHKGSKNKDNDHYYDIFIHEMLCQWKICTDPKKPRPTYIPPDQKRGQYIETAEGRIEYKFCKYTKVPFNQCRNADIVQGVDLTQTFGATLDGSSYNLNFCDIGRDTEKSVDSTKIHYAETEEAAPAAPQRRSHQRGNSR